MSGCYVDAIIDVSKGQFFELGIRLPSGEWLTLPGQVAYAFPGIGFGFEFGQLDERQSASLQNVLSKLGGLDEQQSSFTYA